MMFKADRDSAYLLYIFNVKQFDHFVPLRGSRPGAGALKTQTAEEMEETVKQVHCHWELDTSF